MHFQELPADKQALLLIGLTLDAAHFEDKIAHLTKDGSVGIRESINYFSGLSEESKRKFLTDGFRRIPNTKRSRFFNEIHPDWILSKIVTESPALISVLMRFFPAELSQHILKNLPPHITEKMPKLKDTFQVDPALVTFLKDRFVSLFELPPVVDIGGLRQGLAEWPVGKIHHLFREVGFAELAIAFSSLPQKVAKVLLGRMSVADAEEVAKRIENKPPVSESRIKKAQGHLLALDLSAGLSRQLVLEIGFYMFSMTLLPPLGPYFLSIERKFPVEVSKVLRKYAEKNVQINFEETIEPYVDELESCLARFELQWKQFKKEKTLKNIKKA